MGVRVLLVPLLLCCSAAPRGGRASQLKFTADRDSDPGRLLLQDLFEAGCPHEDPEVYMNITQLITSKGYPCEEYEVETEDGFLLGIQRIPHGVEKNSIQPRPAVVVQHGLLSSSTNWVTNLVNESLGFILADAGFDVWLGNSRGNTYSGKHVKYDKQSEEFWDWSWDQMAKYDLPATIEFVLQMTGQEQLYYIGHSQGTMTAFASLSENYELAQKVKHFYAMAPLTTVGYIDSPIKILARINREILYEILGRREFLPNSEIMDFLAETVCKTPEIRLLCSNILFIIGGFDQKQLNISRLPVYIAHTPAGTSVKNIIHFKQLVLSKKFQMYDYGSARKNFIHYGMFTAPLYDVSKMATPVTLFWADADRLADPKDVKLLIPKLKNLITTVEIAEWSHLDFMWAMDAAPVVYDKIVKMIREDVSADQNT